MIASAGFYEIGMACTPLEAGYSVLGFNHPGFAGSSVNKTSNAFERHY